MFASLISGLVSGGLSLLGGERANKANAASAQAQMEFQREMRKTAYQDAMGDMKKAGLNPIFAYQQGGAPMASGAAYNSQDTITPALNSSKAGMMAATELQIARQSLDKLKAETAAKDTEGALNTAMFDKVKNDAANSALDFRIKLKDAEWNDLKSLPASAINRLLDKLGISDRMRNAAKSPKMPNIPKLDIRNLPPLPIR